MTRTLFRAWTAAIVTEDRVGGRIDMFQLVDVVQSLGRVNGRGD